MLNAITRRSALITGAAATTFLVSFSDKAYSADGPTRYDVRSVPGQEMLRVYARAVALMMAKPPGDPLSWTFQWYIHAIPRNTTKDAEIQRYFPVPSATRTLAQNVWNTCEPHFSAEEMNFLPWHRMYVKTFEEIIRSVSGRADFTLPYWDYTVPANRSVPNEFLRRGDPAWGSLYRADRNPGANAGMPIDSLPQADPINTDSMKSPAYDDQGGDAGLCANLESGTHGAVHGDVGNSRGMGSVPWAANDPIFWLHHCNIDRIWASWNIAGGRNPEDPGFGNREFAFASPSGAQIKLKVAQTLDRAGYTYDNYVPRPPDSAPFPTRIAAMAPTVHANSSVASGPVALGATPSVVALTPRVGGAKATKNLFSAEINALPASSRIHLRLTGVRAAAEVGTSYDVYLNLPAGSRATREDRSYVGTVSFFGLGMAGAMNMNLKGRTISFDVTRQARELTAVAAEPAVTLVPVGKPKSGSAPSIAKVEIVSQ